MRKTMIGMLLFLAACGGSGGGSNSSVDIRDCDVDASGNPLPTEVEQDVENEDGTVTKELVVICGDGQVGDNQDNDTSVNEPK